MIKITSYCYYKIRIVCIVSTVSMTFKEFYPNFSEEIFMLFNKKKFYLKIYQAVHYEISGKNSLIPMINANPILLLIFIANLYRERIFHLLFRKYNSYQKL